MKLGIIGSRNFDNYVLLKAAIESHFDKALISKVVSGGAKGADSLGARWAKENNIFLEEYLPDWERYGRIAGFVRNRSIIENSDYVLACWDGVSKGTGNSLSIAKELKKNTFIVYF